MRVEIRPDLLRWACERNGVLVEAYRKRFQRLEQWVEGTAKPTMKQLEAFAKATYTPIGYFFLAEPPVEKIPIPDLRTMRNETLRSPSPDLLDTIFICRQRQEWYRDHALREGEDSLSFVGTATLKDPVVTAASTIRDALGFQVEARALLRTWAEALRLFIEQAEGLGILVMCSGVVGNNTRRKLNPEEFRGFAIADDLASLVFINGADTRSAQMFTLAHELAHIWIGHSGVTDAHAGMISDHEVERWCNQVAAELLVPLAELEKMYRPDVNLDTEVGRLARMFKVSTLVILRRIHDAGRLTREQLAEKYANEMQRLLPLTRGGGGNYYPTQASRVSRRFARAVVVSAWEGHSSFTEAFRLLGCKKMSTFRNFGTSLGVDC